MRFKRRTICTRFSQLALFCSCSPTLFLFARSHPCSSLYASLSRTASRGVPHARIAGGHLCTCLALQIHTQSIPNFFFSVSPDLRFRFNQNLRAIQGIQNCPKEVAEAGKEAAVLPGVDVPSAFPASQDPSRDPSRDPKCVDLT